MNIVVCAKQVPNTNEVRIDPVKNTLIRDGVPSILNPDDATALEAALRLKDSDPEGTQVTVLTMGPPQASEMLLQCLAMGADRAVLLSHRALGGSDTWATSNALAAAIRKLSPVDLIFAGHQAIDGDTAQVGPQIAEKLDIPQLTCVRNLKLEQDRLVADRELDRGYETVSLSMPCLITAVSALGSPRYMNIPDIFRACQASIDVWGVEELGISQELVGLNASPTKVFRTFTPLAKGAGVRIEGDSAQELASHLLSELTAAHII